MIKPRAKAALRAFTDEAAEARAFKLFTRAMDSLRRMPQPFHVYVASGTPCLMRGPTHDEGGRPLKGNIVACDSIGVRIDGGDW